ACSCRHRHLHSFPTRRSSDLLHGRAVTSTRVWGFSSTRPSVSSCLTASRTGIGLTPKRSASREKTRRAPGCKWPCTISSLSDWYTNRVFVLISSPRYHHSGDQVELPPRPPSRSWQMLPPGLPPFISPRARAEHVAKSAATPRRPPAAPRPHGHPPTVIPPTGRVDGQPPAVVEGSARAARHRSHRRGVGRGAGSHTHCGVPAAHGLGARRRAGEERSSGHRR